MINELPAALAEAADRAGDSDHDAAMLAHTLLLGASVPTASPQWRTFAGPVPPAVP